MEERRDGDARAMQERRKGDVWRNLWASPDLPHICRRDLRFLCLPLMCCSLSYAFFGQRLMSCVRPRCAHFSQGSPKWLGPTCAPLVVLGEAPAKATHHATYNPSCRAVVRVCESQFVYVQPVCFHNFKAVGGSNHLVVHSLPPIHVSLLSLCLCWPTSGVMP